MAVEPLRQSYAAQLSQRFVCLCWLCVVSVPAECGWFVLLLTQCLAFTTCKLGLYQLQCRESVIAPVVSSTQVPSSVVVVQLSCCLLCARDKTQVTCCAVVSCSTCVGLWLCPSTCVKSTLDSL